MELAHGIVSLLRSGIVRMAAVAGRIFVNNEEKQVADIRKEDATEGKVRLRFGNVEASLRFSEAQEEVSAHNVLSKAFLFNLTCPLTGPGQQWLRRRPEGQDRRHERRQLVHT